MPFDEWTPQYDSPEAQEAAAVRFAKEVGPHKVLLRLVACFPGDIDGVTLKRIRALLFPGPHEVPPDPSRPMY